MPEHHRIFRDAELWSGRKPSHVDVDFLGAREDKQFFLEEWRYVERDFSNEHDQWANLPEFSEEYFEWVDFLAAVKTAQNRFVMMELGAGYGRWLMRAAAAVRRYNPVRFQLIGVEPEDTHIEWMNLNFRNNGLDPDNHRIVRAAVGASSSTTYFPVGDPYAFGQFVLESNKSGPQISRHLGQHFESAFLDQVKAVPQFTLEHLAAGEPLIDIIDMDIQGAEAEVMEQAIGFCSGHVRMIHIGTHSRAIEAQLRNIFGRAGWSSRFDYKGDSEAATDFGTLTFVDGVQSWANPRFAKQLVAADLWEGQLPSTLTRLKNYITSLR